MPTPRKSTTLAQDLEKLSRRAYHASEWIEPVLRRCHAFLAKPHFADATHLDLLRHWLLAPISLWPFNITHFTEACLRLWQKNSRLPSSYRVTLELLPPPPDETVCDVVAIHEHQVQAGSYENVTHAQAKFDQAELVLLADPEFQKHWQSLRHTFDLASYQDHKGVIRRTMNAERNLRPIFNLQMDCAADAFRAAFDAFCLRWHLYGMQHDAPLLLKLAVNITPHGTLIHIPAYWSFDPKRDIRWDAITKLHRTRVPKRQGAALAEGLALRMAQAEKLHKLDAEAKTRRLRGEAKHRFLCQGLGLADGTSPRRLSRLRQEFPSK